MCVVGKRTECLERVGLQGLQNGVLGGNSILYVLYISYVSYILWRVWWVGLHDVVSGLDVTFSMFCRIHVFYVVNSKHRTRFQWGFTKNCTTPAKGICTLCRTGTVPGPKAQTMGQEQNSKWRSM